MRAYVTQQQHARLRCFFCTTPLTISGLTFFAAEIQRLRARLLFANERGFPLTAGEADGAPPSSLESFLALVDVDGSPPVEGDCKCPFVRILFRVGDLCSAQLADSATFSAASIRLSAASSAACCAFAAAFAACCAAFRNSRFHHASITIGTSYFPSALTLSHMATRMAEARSCRSPPASFFLPTVRTRRMSGIWLLLQMLAFLPQTRHHASLKHVSMNLRRAFESVCI